MEEEEAEVEEFGAMEDTEGVSPSQRRLRGTLDEEFGTG